MQKKRYQKIIAMLSLFFLLFSIGCGDAVFDEEAKEPATQTGQLEEAKEAALQSGQQEEELEEEGQREEKIQIEERDAGMQQGTLEVHFLDVGQGDCTLLVCDGETMLIDAGDNDKGTYVQNYLQKQGIADLDYVIGTHPDADHIGGLDVVIYKFDCGTIFLPDVENDTATYRDVLSAIESRQYRITNPTVGQTFSLGSAAVTIVAPNRDYGSELNDWSVGVLVQNGENRFLFTGDAGEAAEADMLQNGIDLSADVYKVAHHGSNTATADAFLQAVNPDYAVISVGADNSYGHPQAEVLNRLREYGCSVFRTDEQGTIVAKSDGKTITWNCSPSESWQAGETRGGSLREDSGGANETDATDIVHITENGTKYHKAGCRYLKDSDIEITYEEALAQGYEACRVCGGH